MTSWFAGRYTYGPWHGGPDPLAPPVDLRAALAEIGREVMNGSSPSTALEELLRRGIHDLTGLDELIRRVWQRRSQILLSNKLGGTLQDVQRRLDEALEAERAALAPEPDNETRFREAQLDAPRPTTAAAVRELADYDWRSERARQSYEQIRDLIGQELLEARFGSMNQPPQSIRTEDVERIRRMLAELNELLLAHLHGKDVHEKFAEFIRNQGENFPEHPSKAEELIDALAARAAATQRMLNSMSVEQQTELAELAADALGELGLVQQIATLDANLRAQHPAEDWTSSVRFRGQNPLGLAEGTAAMQELAELDALAEQLAQAYPGARLEDIDIEALERLLGEDAGVALRKLIELERELRRSRLLERRADGSLRLSPKALHRLGEIALKDIIGAGRAVRGEPGTTQAGSAGELVGSSRPWQFGDTEPWDIPRTLRNAVLHSRSTSDGTIAFDITDVEVRETEQRMQAAVALCVDTSWSMVQENHWAPMKRTALALHQLITTRFRTDTLHLIAFDRDARSIEIGELVELGAVWEQGTNMHHALLLAGRHLRRYPDAQPVVLLVTDGEPTAHLEPGGETLFNYPPSPATLRKTINEVDTLARLGASITVFKLGNDPNLAAFVDIIARRGSGRILAPDLDGLGAAVISDYLRNRSLRR